MYKLAFTYYLIYFLLMIGVSVYLIRLLEKRIYLWDDRNKPRIILFIVLLLQIEFAASGDYWSYRMWYDTGIEQEHYEPIWETLRSIIPWGFDLFRLVLWGGCLLLFTIMCKWHKADLLIAFPLFALFYMDGFSYARASIGYMLILFAYYMIIKSKEIHYRRWFLMLPIVVLLISIGIQMHRSMPVILAILAISLFLKPKKHIIVGLLLLFPIISMAFNTFLYPIIMTNVAYDVETSRLMDRYLSDKRGFDVFIRTIILRLPFLLLFLFSFLNIMKKEKSTIVKKIAFVAFLIVYCSFLFYTVKAGNGLALFYRILNMAYPFMIMSVAYSIKYLDNQYNKPTFIIVIIYAIFTLQAMFRLLISPDYLYNQVYERYILGA